MHYSDELCLRTLARMSTTEQVQALDAERQFISTAAGLGSRIGRHAAGHDRDGTFVNEAYDEMRASGYLTLAVPTELGGQGATIRQVAMAQRELARHCASTALASVMHHHVVLFTCPCGHGRPWPPDRRAQERGGQLPAARLEAGGELLRAHRHDSVDVAARTRGHPQRVDGIRAVGGGQLERRQRRDAVDIVASARGHL